MYEWHRVPCCNWCLGPTVRARPDNVPRGGYDSWFQTARTQTPDRVLSPPAESEGEKILVTGFVQFMLLVVSLEKSHQPHFVGPTKDCFSHLSFGLHCWSAVSCHMQKRQLNEAYCQWMSSMTRLGGWNQAKEVMHNAKYILYSLYWEVYFTIASTNKKLHQCVQNFKVMSGGKFWIIFEIFESIIGWEKLHISVVA